MIDLNASLYSGQTFTWKNLGEWHSGVSGGRAFDLKQRGLQVEGKGVSRRVIESFFRVDDDFDRVKCVLSEDKFVRKAIWAFPGLRILRQDPWECALSFVCTPLNNVKRITLMTSKLRKALGEEVEAFEGREHLFPTSRVVFEAGESKLRELGFGFRAKFAFELARSIEENGLKLESLKKKGLEEAREDLMSVHGIGSKVADCILLFSCEKLVAFPVDLWIDRIMRKQYKIRGKGTEKTREFGMKRFGENAGYAQQFLYHAARMGKI